MDRSFKLACVVGARPNFVKMAPLLAACAALGPTLRTVLVHTGQHFDDAMSRRHFDALGLPEPDINLDVGGGSHAQQTAAVLQRFEPVLQDVRPDAVLVVGDVNSTLACALVAAKRHVPVIHVEAGLRSGDRGMAEEINRILTDQLSDLLFTTEASASVNLQREGIPAARIRFAGNVMIDSLQKHVLQAPPAPDTLARFGREHLAGAADGYVVLTLHRASNVDDPAALRDLLGAALRVCEQTPVVFPLHPRTRKMIDAFGLAFMLDHHRLLVLPPLDYLEMLGLLKDARVVLTDSGGIQEETTALGVPCLTLRDNTERPVTVEAGTNTLVGRSQDAILAAYRDILANGGKAGRIPPLWDGHAAPRIAAATLRWLEAGSA
ncbi:MAG: non-hydrolyzing UDP-N-acetylglucosamine 2-epimerase [Telluria sp.]